MPQTPDAPVAHGSADITAQWLQAALGRRVHGFEARATSSTWGAHALIVAQLEGEAAPLRFRVKVGSATVFGSAEVDYYLHRFQGLARAPLVRCHHAAADATHYHLLLDDLALTHHNQDDVEVTEAYGRALVESIARLQAHQGALPPPSAAAIEASLAPAMAGLPVLLNAMQGSFSASDMEAVRSVFSTLPQALAHRAQDAAGYGWVHGDLNPGNILAPRLGEGPVLLIDYQPFLQPPPINSLGLVDLAYAMVLWWPEPACRRWATPMIEHWHACLQALGAGYATPERLHEDWRLCVAQMLMVPASRCGEPQGVSEFRWLWQMQVRRVLAALHDSGVAPA